MLCAVAQIGIIITLTLVTRYGGLHQCLMLAVFSQLAHGGKKGFLPFTDIGETHEQAFLVIVDVFHDDEFAKRLHPVITFDIGKDAIHLLLGEKGKLFKVFARGGVDVDGVLLQVFKQFVIAIPCG